METPLTHTEPRTFLVKIGGSTLGSEDTSFTDIARLQREGQRPIVVHGGGPAITSWMGKMGIRAEFVNGLRVTDAPSLEVATAVLAGLINKQLVAQIAAAGGRTAGICGVDGGLMRGTVTDPDMGLVAGTIAVDTQIVESLLAGGFVPVIGPIATDAQQRHQLLNVNADTAAGAIAIAMGVSDLIFLTDVDGILDSGGRLLHRVPVETAEDLVDSGIVKGGMIPKLQACASAARSGITAHIVNGTTPQALIRCLEGTADGTTVA